MFFIFISHSIQTLEMISNSITNKLSLNFNNNKKTLSFYLTQKTTTK
jgi:hypothetical protein